ncbi:MAG TPA: PEP/pyruvate-binding domain-containing protein [Anaerolineaceae bacterium]|nr:PEP/pyruvate-binding domain-containing protein [Anaerolineaceae bacterium]
MTDSDLPINELIHQLKERAKELNCLYEVQELLSLPGRPVDEICRGLIEVIPAGWQYPEICQVQVSCMGKTFQTPGFTPSPWVQAADIRVQEEPVGRISIYYTGAMPAFDEGPFLKEERKLIDSIADQVGFYILHNQLRQVFQEQQRSGEEQRNEWQVIIDLLKRADPNLLMRITQKMLNFLVWNGVHEADQLLERTWAEYREPGRLLESNQPTSPPSGSSILAMTDEVFAVASRAIPRKVILENIQKWTKEDRSGFLINTLVDLGASLAEIDSAVERYSHLARQGIELTPPREKWFRVALVRRILSEDPEFLKVAKKYIEIDDFNGLLRRVIYPPTSHGRLGGKTSGLFLAEQVLRRAGRDQELLRTVKTPKTWYITSDSVFFFLSHNNLEDAIEQKYKDVNQVRQEYPYIVHVFKNSPLPPELIKGLSLALDDLKDVPLIVRSSSLLEDRSGQAFAGKYKSLFIANQGTREERLVALMDAVKEVFASMFGPDPLEYRLEHELVDYNEGMGILIQEVVGARVGRYYLPAFAGVAFSHNEYRWSSRIRREDGLVRLVPGLGTRAVDRLSDDYPVLVSPGQPGLRVNVTPDEIACYSPRKIDVIDLRSRSFETIEIRDLLKESGRDYPLIHQIVSSFTGDFVYQHQSAARGMDFSRGDFVVTFEGLLTRTPFLKQMQAMLNAMQAAYDRPVDLEFAHDGSHLYVLQCRLQSSGPDNSPAEIPRNLPPERILFSANRYISNSTVTGIQYVVYVDPLQYSRLANRQDLLMVGQVVGRLNQALPRRKFILMGPGRWGSRGDVKLGVSVTYSDISNTAMLIEIARNQDGYVPDLSFGTHFFQDLVEAAIPYLPLYPDDAGVTFNEGFLCEKENLLPRLLPDFAALAHVVRVVDVSGQPGLQIFMNADLEEAVAVLGEIAER